MFAVANGNDNELQFFFVNKYDSKTLNWPSVYKLMSFFKYYSGANPSKNRSLKENETNWWFGVLQNLELIKKWKYNFFNENFTRAGVKARLYLILNFPLNMQAAIFHLSVT
jgi:hypothetical protein